MRKRQTIILISSLFTLTKWQKPIINAVLLPSHAMQTRPISCTASVEPNFVIWAKDSNTGAGLGCGLSAIVSSTTSSITLNQRTLSHCEHAAIGHELFEQPGVFNITIKHPGYEDWVTNGVTVLQGHCHVNTVQITALMKKL